MNPLGRRLSGTVVWPRKGAVDHNSDDCGFSMIVAGLNRGGIESQAIKAAFRSLAESVQSPPTAPAADGGMGGAACVCLQQTGSSFGVFTGSLEEEPDPDTVSYHTERLPSRA